MQQLGHRCQRGFTLVELLVTVAVIAILSTLALIGYNAVIKGVKDQTATQRLYQLVEVQQQYRVGLGRRRFGTLAELRAANTGSGPLLPPNVAPVTPDDQPQAVNGWIVKELYNPSPATLASSFGFQIEPANASDGEGTATNVTVYCIHEDTVLRRATYQTGCSRNSTAVDVTR